MPNTGYLLFEKPDGGPDPVPAEKLGLNLHRRRDPGGPRHDPIGRRRALWDIERWFADQPRRITITGFGGQGKTALAEEAGRWLVRIGLFRAAVFVDYSRVQSVDAVAVAVNEIGGLLD